MLKEIPSNENIMIKTFFQGRFDIVPEAILIVVGTWIGAERYDRILAQLIKRILTNLDIEAEIMTDTYYNEKIEKYGKNPMICIGSGYINYIRKNMWKKKILVSKSERQQQGYLRRISHP